MKIYKYSLPLPFKSEVIHLPSDFEILMVGTQEGNPVMWARVDPSSPIRALQFETHATGDDVDDGQIYVGTFFISWMVWHVFRDLGGVA